MDGTQGASPAAPLPAIDEAELYFLLVQTLLQGPFQQLGSQLAHEAAAAGLLPCRYDVQGNRHPLALPELQQRYSHVPTNGLQLALSSLLSYKQRESAQPARHGLSSLLEAGVLGMLLSQQQQLGAPPQLGGAAVAAIAAALPPPPPPRWVPPFHRGAALPQRLLLRESGAAPPLRQRRALLPAPELAATLRYQKTLRGHRSAVYCVAFDRTGGYVATGSDDRLVKIWSVRTGLLQSSCRGHDAEITDLSVSCDNALLASASMDTTIRIWQLQGEGRMGSHVSVLVGHTAPVTFVDFSPTLPNALLSTSFDGTCRIWNVRDPAAPPLVLSIDPARFGLSGRAMTRSLDELMHDAALDASPHAGRLTRQAERQLHPNPQQAQHGTAGASGAAGQPARHSERLGPGGIQPEGAGRGAMRGSAEAEARGGGEEEAEAGAAERADSGGHPENGEQDQLQLLVCSFSKDGSYIAAGSNDCNVYLWHWPAGGQQAQQGGAGLVSPPHSNLREGSPAQAGKQATPVSTGKAAAAAAMVEEREAAGTSAGGAAGAATAAAGSTPAAGPAAVADEVAAELGTAHWPAPQEVARLAGHRNDVILIYFSNSGNKLATGSKDGTVRVWKQQQGRRRLASWAAELTIACPPDEESVRRARQRRRAPPAPAIDQLCWSCDDQRLVVSVTDHTVRIFDSTSGQLLHRMREHTEAVHVLECHPVYPRLAVSASYDGELVLWDMAAGAVLRKLSSRAARPDGRDWPDALPFTDGHFSPDGSGLALTDVAGQLHYYSFGGEDGLLGRGPYDQFLSTDYHQLIQDSHFNVIDAETQLPPHVLTGRELVCDIQGNAYPQPFQEAFRARRLLAASPQDASIVEEGKQPGYLLFSPLLTAAQWHAVESGASENGVLLAMQRAQERLTHHEAMLDYRARGGRGHQGPGPGAAAAAAGAAAGADDGEEGEQGEGRGWRQGRGEAGEMEPTSSGELYHQPSDAEDFLGFSSEGGSEEEEEEEGDGGRGQRRGSRRSRRRQLRRQRREEEGVRHSARLAQRQGAAGGGAAAPAAPGGGGRAGEAGERHAVHAVDPEAQREQQRMDREERALRRQQLHALDLQQRRRQRQSQAAAAAVRRRSGGGGSGGPGLGPEDGEEEGGSEQWGALEEEGEPTSDEEYLSELEEEDASEEEEEEDEAQPGPSHRSAASRGSKRKRSRAPARERRHARQEEPYSQPSRPKRQRTQRAGRAGGSGRGLGTYSWLAGQAHTPGVFVPQAGDEVVYLREGHAEYLQNTNDKRQQPPWQAVARGRAMRPAEPCRVVAVDYVISDDGHDYTLARLTLALTDEASPLRGRSFVVEVPPPSAGHAEFVVLRGRYDAGVKRCWEAGDQCMMYWPGEEGGGGEWWVGSIASDARGETNAEVLADLYGCGGLWERFQVQWHGVVNEQGLVVSRPGNEDPSAHSPWELFELGTTVEEARVEAPSLDPALRARLLAAAEAASGSERFELFFAAPAPNEKYYSPAARRTEFYNRLVALPLSLTEIISRLRAGYYHQHEAVARDIHLLVQNAAAYNGEENEITEDAQALVDYLMEALEGEGEAPPDIAPFEGAAAGGAVADGAGFCGAEGGPGVEPGAGEAGGALEMGGEEEVAVPPRRFQVPSPPGSPNAAGGQQQGHQAVGGGPGAPAAEAPAAVATAGAGFAQGLVPRRPRTLIIRPPRPPPGTEGAAAAAAGGEAGGGLRVRLSLPAHLRRSPGGAPSLYGGLAGPTGLGPGAVAAAQQQEQQPLQQRQQELLPPARRLPGLRDHAARSWEAAAPAMEAPPGGQRGYSLRHQGARVVAASAVASGQGSGRRYSLRLPAQRPRAEDSEFVADFVDDEGDESSDEVGGRGGARTQRQRSGGGGTRRQQPARAAAAPSRPRRGQGRQQEDSEEEEEWEEEEGDYMEDDSSGGEAAGAPGPRRSGRSRPGAGGRQARQSAQRGSEDEDSDYS